MVDFWDALVTECIGRDEFLHISIDGTLRVAMRMVGQANYRESKANRALQYFNDNIAKRCVLSVRGRTGGVVGLWLIKWEDADSIASALRIRFPQDAKAQVIAAASDDPSGKLYIWHHYSNKQSNF